ncbi:MAG: FCD domain-containing protein [Pseudomonadota bacterium]
MPFEKIQSERVAQAIIRQIEGLILNGILHPGERLPSERELAQRLDVSRPSLRDALAQLEDRGLIETRPGAGAFVADLLGSVFATPLVGLFASHRTALFDYLQFRRDLEGLAAERAATHASPTDLDVISAIFAKMEAAHTQRSPREEARLDAEFHMAIIEASHNVVMLHMMRAMLEMLREGVFYNRQTLFSNRTTRDELLAQHRAMHDAVLARDPMAARTAVEAHLNFVEQEIRELDQQATNERVARLRYAHETGQ